ncbi:tail fiber protein [Xenorhabdus beddingii]|uniref:Tail fiber protein n=1 Tax=Xenorhabdus beddingii TaxID=40578 RepID=A0A1Y2SFR4_9GAMM|nr:phage tail protein [Xenorhabdus beddingii]OTA17189.1 tail fiber protein [Xenorhabdus beddingii]
MSSVITLDFEKWKAQQTAAGNPVVLDEFVFAYVPNLDPSQAISRDEKLPAANHIVHRQAVNKTGLASENAVAYSVTLGTDVGHFDFNWIGLLNKASGTIGMITHAPTQKKIKTANGLQGNVLTRSFLLEFEGAAKETAITTTAETWQIDFTARLTGMDDMQRLINTDSYGEAAFFGDSFAVIRNGDQYTVKKGLAYVGGLRGVLEFDQTLSYMRNTRVYADFSYQGNLVSQWKTVVKITVANDLKNYVDVAGYPHYVFAIAQTDGNGDIMDLRSQGTLSDRDIADIQKQLSAVKENINSRLAKSQNGADIENKQVFVYNLGLTDTVDMAASAIPKSSIAQHSGNSEKLVMSQYVTTRLISERITKSDAILLANRRLEKSQNGADIPDKKVFVKNIGLEKTVELAANAIPESSIVHRSGDSQELVMSQQVTTRLISERMTKEEAVLLAVPVGGILIWGSPAAYPKNYMPAFGQQFDPFENPELVKIYPSGRLPDYRGYVPRGWDEKRKIDSGRVLGSFQEDAIREITGVIRTGSRKIDGSPDIDNTTGAFSTISTGTEIAVYGRSESPNAYTYEDKEFRASHVVPTAHENRMKNVAVIFLVRTR